MFKQLRGYIFIPAAIIIFSLIIISHQNNLDCKSVFIIKTPVYKASEIDALRFNMMRIYAESIKDSSGSIKQSLLLNIDDNLITAISQIRFKSLDKEQGEKQFILAIDQANDRLANIYGFDIKNKSVICSQGLNMYQNIAFIFSILILCSMYFFLIYKKILTNKCNE